MTLLYQDTYRGAFAARAGVSGRRLREEDDRYPVIARIGPRLRVVECRDRLQWIVQALIGKRWRGKSFHRDRDALIRAVAPTGRALAILRALPAYHLGDGGALS
jgi:hypothetical protein